MECLTEKLVKEYCRSILENIGVSGEDEEQFFGVYIRSVSLMYSGYGLRIYLARNASEYDVLVRYDGKMVFASENRTFEHGDWEEVLYELFLKAPKMAAAERARREEQYRKEEEIRILRKRLNECPNLLPMETTSYSIAPGNSGVTVKEYADSFVKVVQTLSGSSWSGHVSTIEVYEPKFVKEKHWYGTTEKCEYELVFDGRVFVDGYWRYHLLELMEKEEAIRKAKADAEWAARPSAEDYLRQIRGL